MMKKNPLAELYEKLSHPHQFGLLDSTTFKALLLQEFKRAGWIPLIDNSTHNMTIRVKSQKAEEFDAHIATLLFVINVKEKGKTEPPILAILTIFELLLRLKEAQSKREWIDLQIRIETDVLNSPIEFDAFKTYYDRDLQLYKDLYVVNLTDLESDPWYLSIFQPVEEDPFTDLLQHLAIQHKIPIQIKSIKPTDRSNLKSLGVSFAKNKHVYLEVESAQNNREIQNGEPLTIAFKYSLFFYDLFLLLDKRILDKIEAAE